MLRCGKHAGRLNHEVAVADPWYCAWVVRERAEGRTLPRDLKALAKFVENQHGGVMEVGKHRGKFFDTIIKDDPEYAEWAASLEEPSKLLIGFQKYVKRQRKRPREVGDDMCSICMDRSIDSAFMPRGHRCACIECAKRLHGPCPICREPIADVLHTFLAAASTGPA